MKKLAGFIFVFLISLSFYADARLVSGSAAHRHDSATGGGNTLSPVTISSNVEFTGSPTFSANAFFEGTIGLNNAVSGSPVFQNNPSFNGLVDFNGTVTFSGTVTSDKACETGYTRITPNLCLSTGGDARIILTRDACTTVTGPTINAKAVIFYAQAIAFTANVGGIARSSAFEAFTDAGCSTLKRVMALARGYEFTAVPLTSFGMDTNLITSIPDGSGNFYFRHSDDAGNQGTASYQIMGYYD